MAEYVFMAGMVASAAASGYSAYSSYQQGKAQRTAAEAEAAEGERQARLENERAGIAQTQGEQEAERRSRILAADIGSTYANFAGNGLLVNGSAKDTVGSVLSAQVREAQSDVSAIRDTTSLNVWTHQANAASLLATAANRRIGGRNAYRAGVSGAIGGGLGAVGSLALSYGQGASAFGQKGSRGFWNPTGSDSNYFRG